MNAGFAMSYGVFQEYYSSERFLKGAQSSTGVIGTTSNGVVYLTMPIFFAVFSQQWARFRRTVALFGVALSCISFVSAAFSTHVWQVILTQGVLAALGSSLIYSPTTLSLGESYTNSNRAVAYGVVFSCKNIVGTVCPFFLQFLLNRHGYRNTMLIWAALITVSSTAAVLLIPNHISTVSRENVRPRQTPWKFLNHETFYIYSIATLIQSSGYGIPQTYLNSYGQEAGSLSQTSATLLLTLFNAPGIISSTFFGYLSDNKRLPFSAPAVTWMSGICSALSAFLLWGVGSRQSMVTLTLFSITFGFFSGGYSATWGGIIKQLEREAADRNEAIDTGVVLGLFNGARGIGYVGGGIAGVQLLKAGTASVLGNSGYSTAYRGLIIFTGITSAFGGWSLIWRCKTLLHLRAFR